MIILNIFQIFLTFFRLKKTTTYAIALGSLLTSIFGLPLNAQSNTLQDNSLEVIEVQQNFNESFTNKDVTNYIKNNIQQLGEYSISESDEVENVDLIQEEKWGNRGDVEDSSIEVDIYKY